MKPNLESRNWLIGSCVTYGGIYWGVPEGQVGLDLVLIDLHTKETFGITKDQLSSPHVSGTRDGFVFVRVSPTDRMHVHYENGTISNVLQGDSQNEFRFEFSTVKSEKETLLAQHDRGSGIQIFSLS